MPGRTESAKPRLSWAKYSILFFGGPHEAFRMHTWGPRPMHSKPPEVEASARKVHWILLILGLGFFSSKNFPFAASIWSSQLQLSDILAPRSEHSQKGLRFLGVWHSGEIPRAWLCVYCRSRRKLVARIGGLLPCSPCATGPHKYLRTLVSQCCLSITATIPFNRSPLFSTLTKPIQGSNEEAQNCRRRGTLNPSKP